MLRDPGEGKSHNSQQNTPDIRHQHWVVGDSSLPQSAGYNPLSAVHYVIRFAHKNRKLTKSPTEANKQTKKPHTHTQPATNPRPLSRRASPSHYPACTHRYSCCQDWPMHWCSWSRCLSQVHSKLNHQPQTILACSNIPYVLITTAEERDTTTYFVNHAISTNSHQQSQEHWSPSIRKLALKMERQQ